VKVKLDDPNYAGRVGIFWFRKTVGTGKALDYLASHLGDPKDKPSSVHIDERLHVKVKLDDPNYAGRVGIFWFRKTVGTGKALDYLASHLGIPSSDSSPRQLMKLSEDHEECTVLQNDQLLASQVEGGSLLLVK